MLCGKSVGGGYLNRLSKSKTSFVYDEELNDAYSKQYVSGDQAKFSLCGRG